MLSIKAICKSENNEEVMIIGFGLEGYCICMTKSGAIFNAKHENLIIVDKEYLDTCENKENILKDLAKIGYRKIPDKAIVLTKEEYEKMRQGIAAEVLAKVRTFVLDNEVGLKYLLDRTEKEYGITKGEK